SLFPQSMTNRVNHNDLKLLEYEMNRAFEDELPHSSNILLRVAPFPRRPISNSSNPHISSSPRESKIFGVSPTRTSIIQTMEEISPFVSVCYLKNFRKSKFICIQKDSLNPSSPDKFLNRESYPGTISGFVLDILGYKSTPQTIFKTSESLTISNKMSPTSSSLVGAISTPLPSISSFTLFPFADLSHSPSKLDVPISSSFPETSEPKRNSRIFNFGDDNSVDLLEKSPIMNLEDVDAKVQSHRISWMEVVDEVKRPPVKLMDRKASDSLVITENLADQIRPHLPPLLRESSHWHLVYSMSQHGISLKTLHTLNESFIGACLVAITDEHGCKFGAFANESLTQRKSFFGNGECFLWKQEIAYDGVTPIVKCFPATMKNEYYILSDSNCLAFGGGEGRFGLWVDDELLNGHSEKSIAFENETLSKQPEFEVMALEVWRFSI
ncbi:oxidation resistance protein 1, partial [Nowakowskiella sp. JEL0078]